jgi:hypothetical protein
MTTHLDRVAFPPPPVPSRRRFSLTAATLGPAGVGANVLYNPLRPNQPPPQRLHARSPILHPYLIQLLSAEHRRRLLADADTARLVRQHRILRREHLPQGVGEHPRLYPRPVEPAVVGG